MPPMAIPKKLKISILLALVILFLVVFWFRVPIWEKMIDWYRLLSDREQIRNLISSFGSSAPPVFMLIQILQVIFAPVPGEATGFIGGYLFGTLPGFIYSSIGLTIGSLLNFMIGRFLGRRFVRKLIPARQLIKIDAMLKRQGIIIVFILFLIPGFPKDYLCLALGLTTLPIKLFILMAAVGRMPGTFALSMQGAFLYEQNYVLLTVVMGACLVLALLCYYYRERIYMWAEKLENK
ncbi:MAG: TVP38/TMEM64 family protein [Desulfobacterales bacterium]